MKKSGFKIRKIEASRQSSLGGFVLRQVSAVTTLAIASMVMAFGIHSVMAAPSANPPAGTVTPTFDGLNINAGKLTLKNGGGTTRLELDATDGNLILNDGTGTTSVSLDANTSDFSVKGTGAKVLIDGDDGSTEIKDTSLIMSTSGSDRVNLSAGANSGSLDLFSAFGITKPYVRMLADGTTSKVDLGGGTIDASQIKNSSAEALGDVYIDDQVRIGSAYTLKVDNITGSSGNTVLAPGLWANNIGADDIVANDNIGRFYNRNTYGINNVAAGATQTLTANCDANDFVVSCSGLLDPTAPYDIDYRGAWPVSSTQCSAIFVNKKATNYNGNMGAYAYCFSPNG